MPCVLFDKSGNSTIMATLKTRILISMYIHTKIFKDNKIGCVNLLQNTLKTMKWMRVQIEQN